MAVNRRAAQVPQCATATSHSHHVVREMCTFVHISLQNRALWDFYLKHCEMGQIYTHIPQGYCTRTGLSYYGFNASETIRKNMA